MVEAFFEEIRGASSAAKRKLSGIRQLPAADKPRALAQPEDRRGDPDQRASRLTFHASPKLKAMSSRRAMSKSRRKAELRRFPPSATSPSVR